MMRRSSVKEKAKREKKKKIDVMKCYQLICIQNWSVIIKKKEKEIFVVIFCLIFTS